MTNKQFEQIESLSKKLWEDINNGHEYSMVTYSEFLGIVTEVWERLQEESVSEFLNTESMIESYKQRLISQPNGLRSPLIDMCLASYKHGINETLDTLNLSNVQRTAKNWEEPVSDDLGDYINELSKQFPEVSFAKLSRIAVRVAKWQKEQMMTKAIDGEIFEMEDNDYAMCSHTHLELCIEPDTLEKNGFKDKDKVKVIVIKED